MEIPPVSEASSYYNHAENKDNANSKKISRQKNKQKKILFNHFKYVWGNQENVLQIYKYREKTHEKTKTYEKP